LSWIFEPKLLFAAFVTIAAAFELKTVYDPNLFFALTSILGPVKGPLKEIGFD
jgi:hypothetical protein